MHLKQKIWLIKTYLLFYQGNVLIDYVINGSNQSIKPTYTDIAMTSVYGLDGRLKNYNTTENNLERP